MHEVIRIETAVGLVQSTSDALAAAMAELVDATHRATERDLIDVLGVSLDEGDAHEGSAAA